MTEVLFLPKVAKRVSSGESCQCGDEYKQTNTVALSLRANYTD
jgi:hypothetical protein